METSGRSNSDTVSVEVGMREDLTRTTRKQPLFVPLFYDIFVARLVPQPFGKLMICHHCRGELKIEGFVSRADECPQCGADIHCCLNCTSYDPHAHNKCREPQAEWVTDREKANFCDFFTPNKMSASSTGKAPGDPRSAFDALFKK